jgi:hypothetical protein
MEQSAIAVAPSNIPPVVESVQDVHVNVVDHPLPVQAVECTEGSDVTSKDGEDKSPTETTESDQTPVPVATVPKKRKDPILDPWDDRDLKGKHCKLRTSRNLNPQPHCYIETCVFTEFN